MTHKRKLDVETKQIINAQILENAQEEAEKQEIALENQKEEKKKIEKKK